MPFYGFGWAGPVSEADCGMYTALYCVLFVLLLLLYTKHYSRGENTQRCLVASLWLILEITNTLPLPLSCTTPPPPALSPAPPEVLLFPLLLLLLSFSAPPPHARVTKASNSLSRCRSSSFLKQVWLYDTTCSSFYHFQNFTNRLTHSTKI